MISQNQNNMKKIIKYIPFLAVAILVGVTVAYAGSLTPPTGEKENTMHSLEDIFNLVGGTPSTIDPILETPTGTPTGAGVTLNDVYDAVAGAITTPPTFAANDATQYRCEDLTADATQPIDLETVCGYHASCTWTDSACTGGIQTPADGYMTWYAGKAACENYTEEGQPAGTTWGLPTQLDLLNLFVHNSYVTPGTFQSDYYWSGITNPAGSNFAYNVDMGYGYVGYGGKDVPSNLVHCAH